MRKFFNVLAACLAVLAIAVVLTACSKNANDPKDRVDKALNDANIKGVHTAYDKDADIVHLQGTVDTPDVKQRAEQVATGAVGTSGKVLDELKVQGMDDKVESDQDSMIRDRLKDEVQKDPVLQDRHINFDVNNGVVTVKGDVRTPEEKAKVTDMVKAIPGVKQLANELDVKPGKAGERNK